MKLLKLKIMIFFSCVFAIKLIYQDLHEQISTFRGVSSLYPIFHSESDLVYHESTYMTLASFYDKIYIGVFSCCIRFISMLPYFFLVVTGIYKSSKPSKPAAINIREYPIFICIGLPIIEELIFRLFLHNMVITVQNLLSHVLSDTFNILLTSLFRMKLCTFIFACAHLGYGGDHISKVSLTQCIIIIFTCELSFLYELTGSLIPCIVAHILQNSIVFCL